MKKGLIGALIVVIIIISYFTIFSNKSTSDSNAIKVGIILPLTGDASEYGKDQERGVLLAQKKFGDNLVISIEDSRSTPKDAVNALNKLLQDQIDICITTLSNASNAIAPVLEKNNIILMTVAADPKLTNDYDNIIRMLPTSEYYARGLADYFISKGKENNIGIIYANDDFGVSLKEAFENIYSEYDLSILFQESYLKGSSTHKTTVSKVLNFNPDAIFAVGYGSDLGRIIKQLRELGYKKVIYGTPEISYNDVITSAGNIENIEYITMSVDTTTHIFKDFQLMYKNEYSMDPTLDSYLAYDEISIISQLKSNQINKDQLYNVLTDYKGITGTLNIDKNGNVLFPLEIKKLK